MIGTNPETITNKLLEKMSVFNLENRPSDFEYRGFLRDAEQLKKANFADGFMAEGTAHSSVGNENKTITAFDKALRSSPEDLEVVLFNYSRALKMLGKFDSAFELIEEYVSKDNLNILQKAYSDSMQLGLINKSREYAESIVAITKDKGLLNFTNGFIERYDELNIDLDELHQLYLLILEVAFNNKKLFSEISISNDYEDNTVILIFTVNGSHAVISNMEMDIIEKLSASDNLSTLEKITPIILKSNTEE